MNTIGALKTVLNIFVGYLLVATSFCAVALAGDWALDETEVGFKGLYNGTSVGSGLDILGKRYVYLTGLDPMGVLYPSQFPISEYAKIYRYDGKDANSSDVFTDINADVVPLVYSAAAFGDYDNDNFPDLVVCGYSRTQGTRQTKLYRNNAGTFVDSGVVLPALDNCAVAWVDFDADGDLDLSMCGESNSLPSQTTLLLRNDGAGVFTSVDKGFPNVSSCSLSWADYDNDNWPDLLITGNAGSDQCRLGLFRNTHDSSFTFSEISTPIPGVCNGAARMGDMDLSGLQDIAVVGTTASGPIARVYWNAGNNDFRDRELGLSGIANGDVAWADMTGDLYPDLLLLGHGGGDTATTFSLIQNAGGVPSTPLTEIIGAPGSMSFVDYDGDGKQEALTTGGYSNFALSRVIRAYQKKSISGTVLRNGAAWGGVDMTLNNRDGVSVSTKTDQDGHYVFSNIANGEYSLYPTDRSIVFTPEYRDITLRSVDLINQNFSILVAVDTPVAVGADLVGRSLTFPSSIRRGGTANLGFTVLDSGNNGVRRLRSFVASIYLSSDKSISLTKDRLLKRVNVTGFKGSKRVLSKVSIPTKGVKAGKYYLGVFLDSTLVIAETNERNNIFVSSNRMTVR